MANVDFDFQPQFIGDGPMSGIVSQLDRQTRAFYNSMVEVYAKTALQAQGLRTLGSSRPDAAAHEAGHAVWYAANGITVTSIKVEPKLWPLPVPEELGTEYWTGLTLADEPPMALDLNTSIKELMMHASSFIAGGAGELLLRGDKFRKGSASDERAMAQVILALVAMKRGSFDLISAVDGIDEVQRYVSLGVFHVMTSNEPTLRRVSAALLRHDEIDSRLAAKLLKEVKRVEWVAAE